MTATIYAVTPAEFQRHCSSFVDIYLTAMDYHPKVKPVREAAWREAVTFPDFHAFCAVENSTIVGIAYGHSGRSQHWWHSQIERGLQRTRPATHDPRPAVLDDYFEIAEVHVLPTHQGKGVGRRLLSALIDAAHSPYAVLSTPEVSGENNRAFALYRSFGFKDFLRSFLFRGDSRPFAVLYLPL